MGLRKRLLVSVSNGEETLLLSPAITRDSCGRFSNAERPLYVDVYPLLVKNLTGVGRFVARLVEALARLTPLRLVTTIGGEHALIMNLSRSLLCGQEICLDPADPVAPERDLGRWARRLLRRPRRRHDPGLASRSTCLFPLLLPADRHFRKELCILFDLTPLLLPWTHVKDTIRDFGNHYNRRAVRCDMAVAISNSTRHDSCWMTGLRPDQVCVGYPGPSLCVGCHASSRPATRSRQFLLVVSTLEPRKNGRFVLEWFLQSRRLDPRMELWWVGPNGWKCNLARRFQGRLRGRTIRFLGMVSDAELCELYRRAACTIYPSLYEGFGFPVLDGLRHGTPVVSSYNSSLQEFAGPGVYYFDPCDPASLDDACFEALGPEHAPICRPDLDERFSWDRLAEKVVALSA
jgi:glycosyltransferase involved in cell wall biosynthesis